MAFSRRPLRVQELAEMLAFQFDGPIPRLNTRLRPQDADKAVLSACSTLVSTIKPEGPFFYKNDKDVRVVQFSHYSVKEFLTSERLYESDNRQYHISPESAQTILAQTCISTLLQPPDIHIGDITDIFPLTEYAAQNWFHHAQLDGVASQIQDGMERLFDPRRQATFFSVGLDAQYRPRSLPFSA